MNTVIEFFSFMADLGFENLSAEIQFDNNTPLIFKYVMVAILIVCLTLIHAIPNKYTPHIATLDLLVGVGGLVALLFVVLVKTVPTWFTWVGVMWLVVSLATSMIYPFRF